MKTALQRELDAIANNLSKEFEVDIFEQFNPGLLERLSKAGIEAAKAGEELKKRMQLEQE